MWASIVNWLQTITGTLIGVVAGAVLTRRSQDQQFTRQREAQRLDRAHTAYQDAAVLGLRLSDTLELAANQVLHGPTAPTWLKDVPSLVDDMMKSSFRLRSEGAINASKHLGAAGRIARDLHKAVVAHTEVIAKSEKDAASERAGFVREVSDVVTRIAEFHHSWDDWIAQQEQSNRMARRILLPWRHRTGDARDSRFPSQ
jgi:hypothetical protein